MYPSVWCPLSSLCFGAARHAHRLSAARLEGQATRPSLSAGVAAPAFGQHSFQGDMADSAMGGAPPRPSSRHGHGHGQAHGQGQQLGGIFEQMVAGAALAGLRKLGVREVSVEPSRAQSFEDLVWFQIILLVVDPTNWLRIPILVVISTIGCRSHA